ncbi:MAG: hypothetical protein ACO3SO_09635, partial [Luteolibacter sp.]
MSCLERVLQARWIWHRTPPDQNQNRHQTTAQLSFFSRFGLLANRSRIGIVKIRHFGLSIYQYLKPVQVLPPNSTGFINNTVGHNYRKGNESYEQVYTSLHLHMGIIRLHSHWLRFHLRRIAASNDKKLGTGDLWLRPPSYSHRWRADCSLNLCQYWRPR